MKKRNFYSFLLVLAALLCSGSLWGETVVLSEGFESNSLATNGWTKAGTNQSSSGINSSAKRTGSYGYRFYYANPSQYLVSKELNVPSGASNLEIEFYYKTPGSYGPEKFKVGYSTTINDVTGEDVFTWDTEVETSVTEWTKYSSTTNSFAIPETVKYIAIAYTANNKYYLYVDDINLTCTVSGPSMSVLDEETVLSSGHSHNFGLAIEGTTKVFTLKNDGTEEAPVSVSHTGNYGATLSAASIPAGGEITLTVTMPATSGSDIITISSTSDAIEDFVLNISGTVRDASKFFDTLLGGSIPEDWTTSGGTWSWSTTNGASNTAWGESYNYRLITPQLIVAEGEQFIFEAQGTYSGNQGIKLEYSTDGSTWTASGTALTVSSDWQTYEVSDIPAGAKYIALHGWHINVRNFYGGILPAKVSDVKATSITSNSVTIGWTPNGIETAWQVSYSTTSGDPDNGTIVDANDASKTISGLTALTTYYVSVRIGTSGVWSNESSFTTNAVAPKKWDFEGETIDAVPARWSTIGSTTATTGSYLWGVYSYNGNKSMRMYNSMVKTGVAVINTPKIELPASPNYELAFDYSHMADCAAFEVKVSTNGGESFTTISPEGGYAASGTTSYNPGEFIEATPISLATYAGQTIILQFYANANYSSGALFVDNVDIREISSCPKPTGVTATNVKSDGATINWSEGSNENKWKLQYSTDGENWIDANSGNLIATTSFNLTGLTTGTLYYARIQAECAGPWSNNVTFTPTCNTPVDLLQSDKTTNTLTIGWTSSEAEWNIQYSADGTSWNTIENVTDNPYTITGLASGTSYQVKVAATCNGTYTAAATFDTECETISVLPWSANFNTATVSSVPNCWEVVNANESGQTSITVFSGDYYFSVESNALRFNGKSSYEYAYALLPAFTAATNTLQISFSHKAEDPSSSGKIELGYYKDSEFTLLQAYDQSSTMKAEAAFPLTAAPADARIAFRYKSNSSYDYAAVMDDITVETYVAPSCANPSKPAISEVTASSAVVTWTSEASEFALQYKKGESEWQDATGTIESPYILSGLDEQSTYTVQVKAICGGGNESEFVASDAFPTDCAAKELGYEMAFGATLDACWDNSVYGFSSQWSISSESTNYYMRYATNTNTSCYGELQTPAIVIPADKETIARFKWQNTGATASLKVSVDGTEPVAVTTDLSNTTSGWVTKDISLSDYKGHTVVFYFRGEYNAAKNKYLYLDDFTVIEKPCETPTNLQAVATYDGAVITWEDAVASEWSLRYQQGNLGWNEISGISSTSYTLTELAVDMPYEVQVKAVCGAGDESEWSASVNFTPVCSAPTALAVTARTTNSATFNWTSSESAWVLQYSTDGENWESENVSANPFTLENLAAGQAYQAKIQSACGSAFSNVVEFTTWCDSKLSLPVELTSFNAIPTCWEESPAGAVQIANSKLCFMGEGEKFIYLPQTDINLNLLSATFTFSGSLEFGYIDAPNGAFQAFETQPTSGVELNMEGEIAAAKYIAIRYNGTSDLSQASISAISIRKTPTCAKPTAVEATPAVGAASVDWTSEATAWNLQYKLASAADWTEVAVAEKPYEIAGLAQGVSYKVRVQANCGEELSDWSDEATFTTNCSSIDALPYYADFSVALSSCWAVFAQDETYYKPYANTAMNQLVMNGGKDGASNNVVVMPPFAADLTDAVISFEYNSSTGANYAQLEVGYVTDKADDATFVALETLAQSSSWVEARVAAATVPAGAYIAFRYAGASSQGDLAIRNLRVINQLVLDDDVDNSAALATNLNGQIMDVQINRTFVCADYFNTLCLPFSLPTLDGTPLAGGELWAFKYATVDQTTDELLFRIIESDHIEAGVPYFIAFPNATSASIDNPIFKNVTIAATEGQKVGMGDVAQLCGIIEQPVVFEPGDQTKLFLAANNTLYWWNGSENSQLNNFRAYFKVNTNSGTNNAPRHGMRARIIKEELTATGVDNVQDPSQTSAKKFIENDQIVIIKNGVKYNIQGQVIR